MNLDPILKNLGKHFSNSEENPEKEIDSIEHVFKRGLKDDFNLESRKIGDLNNDGKIDFDDVLILKDVLDGKRKLDEKEFEYADLNHDGIIDYKDLNLMIELVFESKRAEERVSQLQGVYDELKIKESMGLASSGRDKIRIDVAKGELEQAIANFILQNHEGN